MQVTVEELGPLSRKMKIVMPQDYVAKRLDDAYQDLKNDASIRGFRKGKVPRKVLEQNYGPKIEYDVAEKIIQDTYFDALAETKLDAVVHPEIKVQNFAADGTFFYEAEIDIRPQFELTGYKGVTVEQPALIVTEEEVNRELEALRLQMAPLKGAEDRQVKEHDVVVINFQGYHDGQAMKKVAGENYSVDIGSGRNGKEFEECLAGLRKDEETSREIDFPAAFANPILAGKRVEFRITVTDIKERALPALDDDFAKDVGEEFNSLAELKEKIRERIQKAKEDMQQGDLSDKIMQQLLERYNFDLPKRLVIYEAEMIVKEMEKNLKNQGLNLESTGINRDTLAEGYLGAAEKRVRGDFIIKKIAEMENIKVSEEDITAGFVRISKQYGMPLDEVKKYFRAREDLLPFMNELLNEKVLKFLRDTADIKIVAVDQQMAGEKS